MLLCLYELVAEEQGVAAAKLRGTSQNDILKEYIARGNYIYPPGPSMRLTTDLFAYCQERMPQWNTISISGYHFREKGASAVQEVAFTLSNAIAYVHAAIDAGLEVDEFAPRLAFFFNAHNNVFQEVAKFRAARRMWARIMRERFGARDERSTMLRFHTQTGGVTLTAQQPLNNIVRVALQAFAAVCGGTQSLHTNGFDEALALPTEEAAKLALRTQQVIAHESGAADTVDPFAGSYLIEALTDEIERRASALIARGRQRGGSLGAIDFITAEIDESAWSYQERYRTGQDVVVGVNRYVEEESARRDDPARRPRSERAQLERLAAFRARRDAERTRSALAELRDAAGGSANLLSRSARRCARAPRSARSAGRCARSSAATGRLRRRRSQSSPSRNASRPVMKTSLSSPATMCPAPGTSIVRAPGTSRRMSSMPASLTTSDCAPRTSSVGMLRPDAAARRRAGAVRRCGSSPIVMKAGSQCQYQRPSARRRTFLRSPSRLRGRRRIGL